MMNITLQPVTIRELVDGFEDKNEEGVVGYHGLLNIRPPFQREFVYSDKQQQAVIDSIFKNFPLNVMYWVKNADGTYDLLDGQQRTLSICSFFVGEFFIKVEGALRHFGILTSEQKEHFLNYTLQIYICENGTDQERLDWFRIINIAGETLTNQELLNAVYAGPWITDAKRRFSKTGCVAFHLGEPYMTGTPIRQQYLETVLKWLSGDNIEEYMATHQHEPNADHEWQYFQQVIAWVQSIFPFYRNEMKGIAWGELYKRHKDQAFSSSALEERIKELMMDDDVTNKKGIYDYVLSGDERRLSIRAFTPKMKREAYERQQGICPICKKHYIIEEMEADHIIPWSQGGPTVAANCQMLCRTCNRVKSDH